MPNFYPGSAGDEQIKLQFTDGHNVPAIEHWVEYSLNDDFLCPTASFSGIITGDITDDQFALMKCGSQIQLLLNNSIQFTGYIDSLSISVTRDGGTEYHISARDSLAQAVDACANPTIQYKAGATLADFLKQLFAPFGWGTDDHFFADNSANRNVRANTQGQKFSQGKKTAGKPLKSYKIHQLKPYNKEGVLEFAHRVANRFGLHIWSSADGNTLIAAKPDFDQPPLTKLIRRRGDTNVLDGTVEYNITDQYTHIVADSFGIGGEFGAGRFKAIMVNGLVSAPPSTLDPTLNYKSARIIQPVSYPVSSIITAPRCRPLYIHDSEARTQEELESFVRREMALMQKKSVSVHYTVQGHGQNTPDGYIPWTVDTTVQVQDQPGRLSEVMYIVKRIFHKSRNAGTRTDLELIRLNTLAF